MGVKTIHLCGYTATPENLRRRSLHSELTNGLNGNIGRVLSIVLKN